MFFSPKTMAAAILLTLTASANAHMVMKSPVPYGKSTLDNSPLVADGSNFPCKQRPGVYDLEGAQNVMAIGEPQTLSFTGSAVHGGGSCQVSLTTDLQPTKGSKWMVIKSIEGGCPASIAGNFPADANGNMASTFQYTIPDGITPGQYTIAWSWINKIGNREFYMNCGPATITAAKKKRYAPAPQVDKRQTSFPDMFVANLASVNDCTTPETFDYNYPNPGAVVQSAGTGPYTQLVCGAGGGNNVAQAPTAAGAGAGAPAATSAAAAAADSGAASVPNYGGTLPLTATYPQSNPLATGPAPGIFATGAASPASASSAPAADAPADPVPVAAPVPATAPSASGNGSGSAGSPTVSTAGAQSGPCTDEGAWSCAADGNSFQRCASGAWSAAISMPNGLACSPGVSDTFVETPTKAKRHLHLHGHLRRVARMIGDSLH